VNIPYDQLFAPVAPDKPSGESLIADPDYLDLLRTAKGKPARTELVPGDPNSSDPFIRKEYPAEEPSWEEVRDAAVGIIRRSHDLAAAGWYTVALLRIDGFQGLEDGLGAIRHVLEKHWDTLFPAMDASNQRPAHRRARVLDNLAAPLGSKDDYQYAMLRRIRDTPIVKSRNVGSFSLSSILIASDKLKPPPGVDPPSMQSIEAAFTDADLEQLKATEAAIQACRTHAAGITAAFSKAPAPDGEPPGPTLDHLDTILGDALKHVSAAVQRKQGGTSGAAEAAPAGSPARTSGAPMPDKANTRADVQRALRAVLEFYQADEERRASPVVMFVKTALNLMGRNYTDLYTLLDKDTMDKVKAWSEAPPEGAKSSEASES
jgi:type VI secretion system protein ImpA